MNVFGGAVVFPIVAVADVKRTVGIFVEHVTAAWLVGPKVGVVFLTIPIYLLYAHVGLSHIQHFELAILVTSLENKLCVVRPTQSVAHHKLGFGVHHSVIPSSILHHHGVDLPLNIGYREASAILHLHCHLLPTAVNALICIGIYAEFNAHAWLNHHETAFGHGLIVVVGIVDGNAVVAAHLQFATLVGNLKPIMCVQHICVYRLFHMLYHVICIKSVDIITHKEVARRAPIGVAMLHFVGITSIFVRQVVESDVHRHAFPQADNRH